jgi:arylsulfatase A-like enzyme
MKSIGVGAGTLSLSCASPDTASPAKKPNIIFILADDLGYGDLGCYGQTVIRTPNIDRLAAEGMRFTDHYAGSTVCAPSRCCLMTGLHTGHAYVRGNALVPLRPEDTTIAEILKQAGYTTGLVGKWGLGENDSSGIPNRKGFDYFFGYLSQVHAHNYYPEFLWRNQEKVPLRNEVRRPETGYAREKGGAATKRIDYSHDLCTAESMDFISRNSGTGEKPFFLYAAYTAPHANNEAEGVLGVHGMEVPDYGEYADKDWPEPQKGHAAMISRLDRDIGALMDKLQALGIDDNTLVIFSSDNGPHKEGGADPEFFGSGGPLKGIKRDLYEGGIRVPMIARWPGNIAPGTVSSHVSSFWDFLPTAAEIAGVQPPAGIDGISYAPELLGESQTGHEFLYWEFHEGRESKQAVRMGNWKYVRTRLSQPGELYDLAVDIGETDNIAADHPDIVRKIETYIETARTESEHWGLRPS